MTDPAHDVFVGVDLGTSSLKAVAITSVGDVVARAAESYPTHRPHPQASEQDPATWLAALGTSLGRLAEQVPTRRWAALGLSAMIPTLVLTDHEGVPVGPAITWEDARAECEGAHLRGVVDGDWLYRETGQWVDGRYLIPMVLRIANVDRSRLRRAHWLLAAKDFLFWSLTGCRTTDPSTATGFGCYGLRSGEWLDPLLAAAAETAAVSMPTLPEIQPSTHMAPVSVGAGRDLSVPAGLPVVLGAADSVLAALGLGVHESGDVAYVAGTSTVILGASDSPVVDAAHRFLVTPMAEPGRWGLEMDQLATGSALRWLGELMGMSESEVVERAGASASEQLPLFLPFLAPGEQGALWDPSLSGSISGLTLHHGPTELARALLTGIIVESSRCLDVLADTTGTRGDIRVTGSGASSVLFQRDLADATGRSVVVGSGRDHSAVGAAMLAAQAHGQHPQARGDGAQIVRPDPRAERLWRDRSAAHDAALAAIRGRRSSAAAEDP